MSKQYIKIRKNINTKVLVDLLTNHMLDPDAYPLKQTQLTAANMLLKRTLPELRAVEHMGKVDSDINVTVKVEG